MNLKVTSLASGSSGNAFLVETSSNTLLVDAGLTMRKLERLLRERGIEPSTLNAIVVSHEHHDHAQAAGPLARRHRIPLISSAGTAAALREEWKGLEIQRLDEDGISIGDVDLYGIPLPHDAAEPMGILLRYEGYTAGWVVDLGHVAAHLAPNFAHADLVIVEANHEIERLRDAPYTWPIKQRILSDRGHLSNFQAAALLSQIGKDGRERVAWLAHLSERTNDQPKGVLRTIETYLAMDGVTNFKLAVAERDRPSATWYARLPLADVE